MARKPKKRFIFRDDEDENPDGSPVTIPGKKDADPQVIGEELERITAENDGRLLPERVVDRARDPRNPLHRHFEWDDKTAAEQHRIHQARNLIRSIRIIGEDDTGKPRFPFLSIHDEDGCAYRHIREVLDSAALQNHVMEQALRDLKAFQHRYSELSDICELIREAVAKISGRIKAKGRGRPSKDKGDDETRPSA